MFTRPPVILLLAMLWAMRASAQELEPRAYSASPIGTNFLLVGIGRSSGDVVFDPTVPITDVHADINAATLERELSLGPVRVDPYSRFEVFYDSRFGAFSKTELMVGASFPIRKYCELEGYFDYQLDTGRAPSRTTEAVGMVATFYF